MNNNLIQSILLLLFLPVFGFSQLTITVESGIAFPGYNDVRAPNGENEKGKLFSLADDFQEVQNPVYFRAEIKYLISSKHTIEITAAPLTIETEQYEGDALIFEDKTFTGDNINGRYQFNTYRASYRYRIINKPKFLTGLGATILVRDAAIEVSQNGTEASNTDLGFVPLISLYAQYDFNPKLQAVLKGDALVGPQGRAEDFFLGLQYAPSSKLNLKAGYRIIEGGADVDQVYNFALFHFASLGMAYTF